LSGKQPTEALFSGVLQDEKKTIKIDLKNVKIEPIKKETDENAEQVKKLDVFMTKFLSDSSLNAMNEKINSLTSMCIDLEKTRTFELCESPLTVHGDTYYINAVVKNNKGDSVFKFPTIPFKTYGGFRLNFSTGLAFTFISRDIFYYKEKAAGDSFFIRKGTEMDAFIPSIAGYMHAYWRANHKVTPTITIGLSTNPTNLETTRFFLGGSLIFGDNRRFILSAGITGGNVNRLEKRFKEDMRYADADFAGLEDEDFMEKKFKIGVFLGVSYNLSAKR
jgi:hypothetical protein